MAADTTSSSTNAFATMEADRAARLAISAALLTRRQWEEAFSGKSAGKGDQVAKFEIPEISARFVRFVSQGNNENKWVNLHTFRI